MNCSLRRSYTLGGSTCVVRIKKNYPLLLGGGGGGEGVKQTVPRLAYFEMTAWQADVF